MITSVDSSRNLIKSLSNIIQIHIKYITNIKGFEDSKEEVSIRFIDLWTSLISWLSFGSHLDLWTARGSLEICSLSNGSLIAGLSFIWDSLFKGFPIPNISLLLASNYMRDTIGKEFNNRSIHDLLWTSGVFLLSLSIISRISLERRSKYGDGKYTRAFIQII